MIDIEGVAVGPQPFYFLRKPPEVPSIPLRLFRYAEMNTSASKREAMQLYKARYDAWMSITQRHHLPDIFHKEDVSQTDIDAFQEAINDLPLSTLRFMHGLFQANEKKGVIRGSLSAVIKKAQARGKITDISGKSDVNISISPSDPIWELHFLPAGSEYRGSTREERRANVFLFATDMLRMIDFMNKRKITPPKMLFGHTNAVMGDFLQKIGFHVSAIGSPHEFEKGRESSDREVYEQLYEILEDEMEVMRRSGSSHFAEDDLAMDVFLPTQEMLAPEIAEKLHEIQTQIYKRAAKTQDSPALQELEEFEKKNESICDRKNIYKRICWDIW